MAATRESALHAGPKPVVGAALVAGAATLWATFGLFAKHLYAAGFAPLELASVRAFIGFVGAALYVACRSLVLARRISPGTTRWSGPVRAQLRIPVTRIPFFAAYGILGFALFEYAFFAALDHTSVAVAVALLYTAPAFVALASALVWRERIGPLRWLALGLVLAGVMLVTGAAGALLSGNALLSRAALLLGLTSGATYALYTMFSKIATERHGPAASLFWSFFFAAAALAIVAQPISPLLRAPRHLIALIGLGVVPTLLPYALYLLGLQQLRASTAAMLASIEPAIATVLAALVIGEVFDVPQGAGVALIVAAAVLLSRSAPERAQSIVRPST